MTDRETVRMAYRLILGREPESDTVLDRRFEDIHALREEFLNSKEFSREYSKVPLSTVPIIDNGVVQITHVNDLSTSFFCVIHSKANDPISQSLRNTKIPINHELLELFKTPCTFLDLGANIGAFSLPFGAIGWKGYAFEASSINVNVLKKSICLNDFDITVINKAVYDKTGSIYFGQSGPFGLIQNEITAEMQWEEIPCICLDDWYKQEGAPIKIDFIKMDIEGSEVSALRGMRKMLENYGSPPVFVESNTWTLFLQNETQKTLLSTANEIGYVPYILENGSLLKYDINNFPILLCTDFLLLKDIPKNLKPKTFKKYVQKPNDVITFLSQTLSKVYESNSIIDKSVCYALKDFPDYVSNMQIKVKLEQIAQKNAQDKFLKKYLGWFIQ
jgi:FkbM family methyltransferase